MQTGTQQDSTWRYLWLIALVALPVLSWSGVLDHYSSEHIDASISSAGLIYGTARGINALISLLQGTELNVPFITFSIGEVLDPVNDLIERFSDIILLALGSLALQKILLAVVSNTMFNILLTLIAVGTGLSLFMGSPNVLRALLRAFLVIAFFRFSLGLVVLANSWVDATFLDPADQQRHAAMEKFQGELRQIDTLSKRSADAQAQLGTLNTDMAELVSNREAAENRLRNLADQTKAAQRRFDKLRSEAGGLCRLTDIFRTCPDDVQQAKAALDNAKAEHATAVLSLASITDAISTLQDKMDCLEKHSRGENCNFWDSLPKAPDTGAIREKLNAINANLSDFAENCINLLVSLLLKTVAIPFLFIYLLLRIVQTNWARI